jgi:polyhydroxyalkanoate synthesis regulator phasin
MAALGNGNTDEGADVMDETVKQIRKKAYGSEKQPNEINGLAALKPLIERV